MKKEILDEIINLKSRKQELEAECGVKDHNMNVFSHDQLNHMETDMQRQKRLYCSRSHQQENRR